MALILTIGGINRTSVLHKKSIVIEQQAADFISICSLTLYDVDGSIAIAAEDAITVVDTATYFSGRIVDIRYTLLTAKHRLIHLKCQDLNYQLIETVVDTEEVYPGDHPGVTADSAIIDDLFDTYLNTVTSDDFALNQTIQDPLTITIEPTTLRSALSQIATRTGGYFYIDFDNKLHYFSAEASGVAWFLSDDPDQVTSFSYLLKRGPVVMESTATTRLDGVYVIGAGIEGWRGTHAVGDRQAIVRDNRITTATGRDERGDAILAKYGAARTTYTVSTYKTGLKAGMDIRFVCALYGVDATFDVRRMVVRWDKAGTVYFTLTLGDVVNPSLVGERTWTDTLDGALRPVSAPRLPTSSRGWSHDIIFSATDNDTVAWADAGTITLADGTAYAITVAGNTGNMTQVTYIYLDIDTATNALQVTTTAATAVGSGKILIAVAEDVADAAKDARFQVFGGDGQGVMITADNIVASTITGNEINANSIAAGHIIAGAVQTDKLDALAVTAAKIAANTITADKISMGMGDALYNAADGLLLLGPHCEISPTEWWSLRKQKATLSGAFHQEAGRWIDTRGLVIEEATTNLILNPSIEVDTTSWAASSCTISRDTTYAVFGDASLKVITDNVGAIEGPYSIVTAETAANTEYTLSVYLRGSGTVRLYMWDAGGGAQYGSVITLTDVWTRHSMVKTFGAGVARRVGVLTNVQQDTTFYCDGFQLEEQDYATSYCDGTLGTGYAWTGAAHGSTSTRTVTEVNLDAHAGLISSNPTLSFRIVAQMPYDADAEWPGAANYLFDIYSVADRIVLAYRDSDDKFAVWIDGADRLVSAAQTFKAGDWLEFVLTLDFTANDYNLYIDAALADNDTTALAAQVATDWTIGSKYDGALYWGGFVFCEYAVFDRVLTAIEIAGMYALQRPLVDAGAMDSPGIYLLDGRFRIASSTTGNRVEITADEIAGYSSAGVKQFYLSSADGVAYAGAGAVVLNASGLYTVGDGAGLAMKIHFLYDDSGTLRTMGREYGAYGGGATPSYVWVNAMRGAGDPWNGAQVVIQASDSVAATDVRIYVNSNGIVTITGDELKVSGKLHLDDGEIEFDAGTGNNLIEIPNNVADALHITDTGALEWLRIITTGGTDSWVIDPAGAGIKSYVGMMPTPDGIFGVGLPTENFEIIDAGSAGATEQDWVKIEIGGVVGYLHVFAAV